MAILIPPKRLMLNSSLVFFFSRAVSTSVKQNEVSSLSINLVIELSEAGYVRRTHKHTNARLARPSPDEVVLCCQTEEALFSHAPRLASISPSWDHGGAATRITIQLLRITGI